MNPEQLSAKGTEHGQQSALFAWSAMAQLHGFAVADDMDAYIREGMAKARRITPPVPQLRWLHAIPNGGARDPVTAARMKAEGVKRGIPDVFLPVARYDNVRTLVSAGEPWHGLYIEMKTSTGKQSDEQIEFAVHCNAYSFKYVVCRSWREAADAIKNYLT